MIEESPACPLPLLLAGPILRRCTPERLAIWIATSRPACVRLRVGRLELDGGYAFVLAPGADGYRTLRAGARLHFLLLEIVLPTPLPHDRWIGHELALQPIDAEEPAARPWLDCTGPGSGLCHDGQSSPGFVLPGRVGAVLHGSCRKPHFEGRDGLAQADRLIARLLPTGPEPTTGAPGSLPTWPSALALTGDQVYMDDVAGPMLVAIHRLIERLGLPVERFAEPAELGLATSTDL